MIVASVITGCVSDDVVNRNLTKIPQDNLAFVTSSREYAYSQELVADYLKRYFAPWQQVVSAATQSNVLADEQQQINIFSKHPGWGENTQKHDPAWMPNIVNLMQLATYPNLKMPAIVTRDTELRLLPTQDPSFDDWRNVGQGYPFDNLQISYLNINTPIYVLHASLDGAWALVITPYQTIGWIKTLDLAYINYSDVKNWVTENYVVATFDHQSLVDQQMHFYGHSHIGQMFPLYQVTNDYYQVIIPLKNDYGYAIPKIVNIRKSKASLWPIPLSQKNIAQLANNMLGQPYGWGELNNYRDCSSMMEALFAPFAIWLPRNSQNQVHSSLGKFVDLSNYTAQQKQAIIINQGKPFLTLLWFPGHIMLYIGVKDGAAYVFENVWGLVTEDYFSGEIGRAIIGKTVIIPLDFGAQYVNVDGTFLERTEGMNLLLVDYK
jgi:hypothetical protein